jgi:hypothetical protein
VAYLDDEQHGPKSAHYAEDDPGKDVAYLLAFRVFLGGGTLAGIAEERRFAYVHSSLVPPCGDTNEGGCSGQTNVEDDRVQSDVGLEERGFLFEDTKESNKLDTRENIPQRQHDKLGKIGNCCSDD